VSTDAPSPDQVANNTGQGRFELAVGDRLAFMNYRTLTRGELGLIHTEVPEELSGRGIGSAIGIHGTPGDFFGLRAAFDWTAGCIAVTDDEAEELYRAVRPNAVIEIHP